MEIKATVTIGYVVKCGGPGRDVLRCLASIIRSIQSNCSGENGVALGSDSAVATGIGSTGGNAIVNDRGAECLACQLLNSELCSSNNGAHAQLTPGE